MSSSPVPTTFVIDDDELSRELLTLMLESEGHAAHGFSSGEDALQALHTQPAPAVVLADLQMPGLCGNPLAQAIRAATPPATILLAISGRQVTPAAVSAFDGFLLKPFTAEQLTAAIANPPIPAAQAAPQPGLEPEGLPAIDSATYQRLSASMKPEQLRQLYEMTLADAANRTRAIQSAADAGDQTTFIREAHALQGGCGMVGALELRAIALAMETGGLPAAALLPQIAAAMDRLQRMLKSL